MFFFVLRAREESIVGENMTRPWEGGGAGKQEWKTSTQRMFSRKLERIDTERSVLGWKEQDARCVTNNN